VPESPVPASPPDDPERDGAPRAGAATDPTEPVEAAEAPATAATAAPDQEDRPGAPDGADRAPPPAAERAAPPPPPPLSPYPSWAVAADARGRPVLPPPPPPPPPAAPEDAAPSDPAGPAPGVPGTPVPWAEAPAATDDRHPLPRRGLESSPPASWAPDRADGAPADVGRPPPPAAGPLGGIPGRLIGLGVVAVAVLVVALVLAGTALRGDGGGPDDVVGRCFAYTAGAPRRVDRVVACDGPHDGVVLARAADAGACPAETTAVLAAEADTGGRGPVLCIRE
jgi:hypothetical protein